MNISEFKTEEEYATLASKGMLLNPRIDSTFKALFTQDTADSKGALLSFLEAATEKKIKDVKLQANDVPKGFEGQRNVSFDILCIFDDGLSADIEMQAFNQKYDYGKRAEYQVARLETTYLKKGDTWEDAPKVYQITVLDFNYKAKKSSCEVVSRYAMRTKDGRELSNTLNIIFIELPKVEELEESLETNTMLENWAIFLKEADNPQKADVISRLTQKEAGLMLAQNALSSISANKDFWIAQYRQELHERDELSSREVAKIEGREEGVKLGKRMGIRMGRIEGIRAGKKEGMLMEKQETARRLLSMNLSVEDIAKATGLSADMIKEL